MNRPRQDAWTKEEDTLLVEIVLRHIRMGKTQLEAFKEAGEKLDRTAAACGFRWNATLRNQYAEAIILAKNNRKKTIYKTSSKLNVEEQHTIDSAISMLEKVKEHVAKKQNSSIGEQQEQIEKLQAENVRLKQEIKRYQEAWSEMGNIWKWIENKNEH